MIAESICFNPTQLSTYQRQKESKNTLMKKLL